ncbi:hypothetical protein F4809DRAFT_588484 [Biscogniauxia mediterranea]|nr:hypothetical protein F4809DRAFT_588484 [Biscogniauxia mediterranea]
MCQELCICYFDMVYEVLCITSLINVLCGVPETNHQTLNHTPYLRAPSIPSILTAKVKHIDTWLILVISNFVSIKFVYSYFY